MARQTTLRARLSRRGFLGLTSTAAGLFIRGAWAGSPDRRLLDGDPALLSPLEREHLPLLRLPEKTRFVAGLLHERRTVAELRPVLNLIDSHLTYPVDVAASCGLGRRSPDDALAVMWQGAELSAD